MIEVETITEIAQQIYTQATQTKANKAQSELLASRVARIKQAIQGTERLQDQQFAKPLGELQACVQDASALIKTFPVQQQHYDVKCILQAGEHKEAFETLYQRLRDCVIKLNLDVEIQSLFSQIESEQAQQADATALLDILNGIIDSNQQALTIAGDLSPAQQGYYAILNERMTRAKKLLSQWLGVEQIADDEKQPQIIDTATLGQQITILNEQIEQQLNPQRFAAQSGIRRNLDQTFRDMQYTPPSSPEFTPPSSLRYTWPSFMIPMPPSPSRRTLPSFSTPTLPSPLQDTSPSFLEQILMGKETAFAYSSHEEQKRYHAALNEQIAQTTQLLSQLNTTILNGQLEQQHSSLEIELTEQLQALNIKLAQMIQTTQSPGQLQGREQVMLPANENTAALKTGRRRLEQSLISPDIEFTTQLQTLSTAQTEIDAKLSADIAGTSLISGLFLPETWHIPSLQHAFVGRHQELEQLQQMADLKQDDDEKHTVVSPGINLMVITGSGGIGKTQLALKYVHEVQSRTEHTIIWFNAENQTQLDAEYRIFAQHYHPLPIGKEVSPRIRRDTVKQFLSNSAHTLVVYNNAENYEEIVSYLPESNAQVLITSQHLDWPYHAKCLELPKMSAAAAVALLQTLIGQEDADCEPLVETLDCLPLALVQAGVHIKQTPGMTISKYLQCYEECRYKLAQEGSYEENAPHNLLTIAATCEMSLEAIALYEKSKQQPLLSRAVLILCSYLAADNIPYAMIQQRLARFTSEQNADSVLARLRDYRIISVDEDKKYISLHRSTQAMMHHQHIQQSSTEDIVNWWQLLIDSIHNTFNQASPSEENQWHQILLPHLQCLLHHAKQQAIKPITQALLMDYIGRIFFYAFDDAIQAKMYYQNALDIIEEAHHGEDHTEIGKALSSLATTHIFLGDTEEGRALLERALKIEEAHYGPNHTEVARTLGNLSAAYGDLGDMAGKKALLERALKIFEAHPNSDYIEISLASYNLPPLQNLWVEGGSGRLPST